MPGTIVLPPRELDSLSLGYKISFVLVFPQFHVTNNDIERTAKDIVRHTLQGVRFWQDCKTCKTPYQYSLPVSSLHRSLNHPVRKYWQVDIDDDAHLHDGDFDKLTDRYFVVGLQVISRAFRFHGDTKCPKDPSAHSNFVFHDHHGKRAAHHWTKELKAVDEALILLGQRPNYRVITNEFTNFQVYNGNDVAGVHMDVSKSLLAIFTAFERQFDAINITTRIGGGVRGDVAQTSIQQEAGESCKPMSTVNMAHLKVTEESPNYNIPDFLRMLLKSKLTRSQLPGFIDNNRISSLHTALDVSRVWDSELLNKIPEYVKYCMKKPTIGFRSHAGTLNSEEQIAWIDLCSSLTEFCYQKSTDHVFRWLSVRWHIPHTDYTIMEIMRHIGGIHRTTFEYYRTVSSKVADLDSRLVQPHLADIIADYDRENAHSDPLKETKVVKAILARRVEQTKAENVRDEIKQKFELGLYGKFPEDTVVEFCRTHGEKIAYVRGDHKTLILD
ncbi:hypothetical protein E4T42_04766 [Aureobasidium subglaciale]|nr:hypothetical protein E4T42_04766 [Aureobasidium subglaciale]